MPNIQHNTTPIIDALHVFELNCRVRRFSAETIQTYNYILRPFVEWLPVDTLQEVTPAHVRAYMVYKQDSGAAPGYLLGIGRTLRAFFNFCVADNFIDVSPMRNVPMPRTPKRILSALFAAEVRRLLAAAGNNRDRAILLFMLDTGVRASELCAIKRADIDLRNGSARILEGKGDKERIVYFGAKTARAILRHVGSDQTPTAPLFESAKRGGTLTRSGLFQLIKRIAAQAGIDDCSPHTLRRTFAINSLRNGMNLYVLARLMGHSDIAILRQYLDLTDGDARDAAQRFGVVDNL